MVQILTMKVMMLSNMGKHVCFRAFLSGLLDYDLSERRSEAVKSGADSW